MPFRTTPPKSDRGSIQDIQKRNSESLEENPDMEPTEAELRIKHLYEHAMMTKDDALIASLGIIAFEGDPKNPVSIMRHREYVKGIAAGLGIEIKQAQSDIEDFFSNDFKGPAEMRVTAFKQANSRNVILSEDGQLVKTASGTASVSSRTRSFWRAK